MKRWEVVAQGLTLNRGESIRACFMASVDPDDEMDLSPARDLGLDIAAAMFITHFGSNYGSQLAEWEALTGREKEVTE